MKSKILNSFIFISVVLILMGSVRGLPGNPTENNLLDNLSNINSPFELSPEKGRFALTFTMVEKKGFEFSVPIARFVTPDVAYQNGKYVSLFAPGVSVVAIPGYIIGKNFGVSQLGTFAIVAIFALLNFLLIRQISQFLGASKAASTLASIIFLFATPAFAYAVTLYQHHLSVFLILSSIFLLLKFKDKIWTRFLVWIIIGLSISIDYPNLYLFAPIGFYMLASSAVIKKTTTKLFLKFNVFKLFSVVAIVIPLALFLWYNQASYGNPLQLAGTLQSVDEISNTGQPVFFEGAHDIKKSEQSFFATRNILNGLYIHFLSPDRGVLTFTPIMMLFIPAIYISVKRKIPMLNTLIAIIGVNILLYSMWGDPWGGWAFGSRYLIPTYALASIFIALYISSINNFSTILKKLILILSLLTLLLYSTSVNTLGALTTNSSPPQIQILSLEKISGVEQKYSYDRNLDFLIKNGSKSFVYQTFIKNFLSAWEYYLLVVGLIITLSLSQIFFLYKGQNVKN